MYQLDDFLPKMYHRCNGKKKDVLCIFRYKRVVVQYTQNLLFVTTLIIQEKLQQSSPS